MKGLISAGVIVLSGLLTALAQSYHYPSYPVDQNLLGTTPYSSVGLLDFQSDGYYFRGSAAVVEHEQVVYTCGHNVLSVGGIESTELLFSRAWSDRRAPGWVGFVGLRGFLAHGSYSSLIETAGPDSDAAFATDFAVAYARFPLGEPLTALADGVPSIISETTEKMIIGYPARLDFKNRNGGYLQHATGPFTRQFSQIAGQFYEVQQATTGSGNSGGPVMVLEGDEWKVAGVLTNGTTGWFGTAGIYVTDSVATNLAADAITLATGETPGTTWPTTTVTVSNNQPGIVANRAGRYLRRTLSVKSAGSYVTSVSFSLTVSTNSGQEFRAFIRSPSGRITPLIEPGDLANGSAISLNQVEATGPFWATKPAGTWSVFVGDTVTTTGQPDSPFLGAELAITSR
ncbi:MAG: hypothetical protein SFU53_00300 [Terrimicrobiaceae bacterium]|nr:hypothetical protein [Terrimicrobiaceae bacterium]